MLMSAFAVSAVEDMPPSIDSVTHEPFYPTTVDSVDVCANVTDDLSVESVEVHWESTYEDEFNSGFATMAYVAGDTYCKSPLSFGLLGIVDGREVTYYVTAEDGVNEPSVSEEYSFIYDGADPTADAGGPYTCDEGTNQVLDGDDSDDTVDTELDFAWDLDNDGAFDDSEESNPEFPCVDDSVNTVSLKVTDNVGNEDVDTTTVTVENVAPEADAGGVEIEELEVYYCSEGDTIFLNASASSDDGVEDDLSYAWDFDEDEEFDDAFGATPEYICGNGYAEFMVSVQVTDDDGGVSEASSTVVVVSNEAPEVNAGEDQTVEEGEMVTVNPTFTDFPADTHSAEVCWGDESECDLFSEEDFMYTGEGWNFTASHTYVDEGEYGVTVSVEELGEEESEGTDSLTVMVENVDPVITDTGEPYTGVAGDSICFYAEATDQGAEDELSYYWSFPGYYEEGDNCYTWEDDFVGNVTLTVTDGDGGEDTAEVAVTVYDYGIELNSGENLISIPLVPQDTSVEAVLNGVNPEVVWAYKYDEELGENRWYVYAEGAGDLDGMVPGYGYYVIMEEESEDILFNNGDKFYNLGNGVPLPPQETLTPGWNLIGHYGLNEVYKESETGDLAGSSLTDLADVTLLNENAAPTWYLVPGEGYWAFITGENNVLYAPSSADYSDEYWYD